MEQNPRTTVHYQRARFTTRLPSDRLYTPSHFWLAEQETGVWRVGFTRFVTRMLGEVMEYGFGVNKSDQVMVGQTIGWMEGFKAVTDLYSVVSGEFLDENPALKQDITLIDTDPYGEGWLYTVRGQADPGSVDVHGYVRLLDQSIDTMREKPAEPD